jgi:hypothetical protein
MNHAAFDGYTCGLGDVLPDATDDEPYLAPPSPSMEFLSPRAREGQCLPAWVRRAAHWQGRAGICGL